MARKQSHNPQQRLTRQQMNKLKLLKEKVSKMVDCPTKKKLLEEIESKLVNKLIKK